MLHKLVQRLHAVGLLQHDLTTSGVCKDPQAQATADRWGQEKKVDKHLESNSEMHMAVCKLPSQYMPELEGSLQVKSAGGSGGSGSSSSGSGGSSSSSSSSSNGSSGSGGSSSSSSGSSSSGSSSSSSGTADGGGSGQAFEPTHYYDGKSLVAHNSSGLALGLFRRIDLKTYPADRFAFALLYFTGSKELNTKMRYHARQNFSLLLSDKELVPVQEGWKHGKWVGVGVGKAWEEVRWAVVGGGKRRGRFSHTCCPPACICCLSPLIFVARPALIAWHRLQAHQ
jgi:hypothetical protein